MFTAAIELFVIVIVKLNGCKNKNFKMADDVAVSLEKWLSLIYTGTYGS